MLSILILVFVATASTKDYRPAFEDALSKFSVRLLQSKSPAHSLERYQSFTKFAKAVDEVNANDELTFSAENNFMSILTEEEKKAYMGLNLTGHINEEYSNNPAPVMNMKVAKSRDFSKKIGPIKDQGTCGSCWAFAAAAALEGEMYFTNSKTDVSLSEQEFMDCSTQNDGCKGGWMKDCYTYSTTYGRIAPSSDYSYRGKDSRMCHASGKTNAFHQTNTKITGNIPIRGGDLDLLRYASRHIVSVAISTIGSFHAYKNGIYNDRNCNSAPNHAVAVVGYGSNYWKVRNSWGVGWGDKGYIKMSRDVKNICLISNHAHIPRVECRDNRCTVPNIDDGGDDGGDEDGDDDPQGQLCKKRFGLGRCYNTRNVALAKCNVKNIPKSECIVIQINNCYRSSVWNTANNFVDFYGPCKEDGED